MWSKKFCDSTSSSKLSEVLGGFLGFIHFHMIPANVLMKEIHPLGIVPYHIIMNALAYQVFSIKLHDNSEVYSSFVLIG
jgi:hypothetical protein